MFLTNLSFSEGPEVRSWAQKYLHREEMGPEAPEMFRILTNLPFSEGPEVEVWAPKYTVKVWGWRPQNILEFKQICLFLSSLKSEGSKAPIS